jgi:hypothetical protein
MAQVTNTLAYNTEILITTVNSFTIQVTTRRQMFWSKNDYNNWTRVAVAIRDKQASLHAANGFTGPSM